MEIGKFIEEHPALSFGIAFVGALVIWTIFAKKHGGTGTSTAQDLSGVPVDASGNHVVYVPTQTSFSTSNIGAEFSNDPNLQSIQTGNIVTNSPISTSQQTTTTTTTVQKSAPPAVIITKPAPPPPIPAPPTKAPPPASPKTWRLFWDYPYPVKHGDTLSGLAAAITAENRRRGMPGNMAVTWQMIYDYNRQVIDSTANAHGNPIPGGPWNNIFPGEIIWVPNWEFI